MQVLIIGLFAYWFAAESKIPQYIVTVLFRFGVGKKVKHEGLTYDVKIPIRLYPFDCEKCLAFWLGVLISPFTLEGILSAGVSSLVAIVTGILIRKFK